MIFKSPKRKMQSSCLQEVQRKLSSFEDDILPHLPEKDVILARAKQRQMQKKHTAVRMITGLGLLLGILAYEPLVQGESVLSTLAMLEHNWHVETTQIEPYAYPQRLVNIFHALD